jgi:hypothetical protein
MPLYGEPDSQDNTMRHVRMSLDASTSKNENSTPLSAKMRRR